MAFDPIVIERGLRAGFARSMAQFGAARSLSPNLMSAALEINSDGAYERFGWFGSMPVVQEWIGELQAKELADYDFTIRNTNWAAAVPINEDDIDDDQTSSLQMVPDLLAQRVLKHPEKLMIQLLTGGTSGLAYDGVAFFSDATGNRAFDNLRAGTGVTIAQVEADLNNALVTMAQFTDDNGEALDISGNMIVCPRALENTFRRLVDSFGDATLTNANTFNPYRGKFTVVADARLDAADANDWYLLATNEIVKPFVYSKRRGAVPMLEKVPGTRTWTASASYRGNIGYALPQLALKVVN